MRYDGEVTPNFQFFSDDWVWRHYPEGDNGPIEGGEESRLIYWIGSHGKDGVSFFEIKRYFYNPGMSNAFKHALYCHRIVVQRSNNTWVKPPFYFSGEARNRTTEETKITLPFFDARGEVIPWGSQLDKNGVIIPRYRSSAMDPLALDFWNKAEKIFSEGLPLNE